MKPEYEREVAPVISKVLAKTDNKLVDKPFSFIPIALWCAIGGNQDFFFDGLGFNVLAYS